MSKARLILVVETSAEVRASVAFTLWAEGYRVATVANAREAVKRLSRGERPCLLLLGQSFAPLLSPPALAGVPIVLLGGDADAREEGPVDRLRMPVTDSELVAAVRRHCGPAA